MYVVAWSLPHGINPAGPDLSRQRGWGDAQGRWTQLFDFTNGQPHALTSRSAHRPQLTWLGRLRADLLTECVRQVFAGRRRDFESIGLGWAASDPAEDLPGDERFQPWIREAADAAIGSQPADCRGPRL
jgi:hypothetical protein